MVKFDKVMNTIFDNALCGIILFIIFSLLFRCSSPQVADTVRINERSKVIVDSLDTNDCLTETCKKAMFEAKELIKDSLDVMVNKDNEIAEQNKKIQSESFYTNVGRNVIWGTVSILVITFIVVFRNQILTLIKIVL